MDIEADRAQSEERLRQIVTSGDMRAFNAAMPIGPSREDVMARAVPVSRVAAKIAARMDEPASISEIAEQLFADDERCAMLASHCSGSAGVAQCNDLVEYLNSPRSRGKMLPPERDAARMWAVDGLSENDIARRQGVHQSTVHRRIDAAKKKARLRT